MKLFSKYMAFSYVFFLSLFSYSQRAKEGNYTVTASNTVVNTYTTMTANASAGATSISVTSNAMSGGVFSGNLAAGDLIMIIQMQGASIDVNTIPTAVWGGNYTVMVSEWIEWWLYAELWGTVLNYNNSGKFEQVEVKSVSGSNTINLQCGLQNNYTSAGKVQVIRVPRFDNLTLNSNTSIVPTLWNASTGGVVAIEVNGNLTLNANSRISASGYGFRGAVANNVGTTLSGGATCGYGPGYGCTFLGSNVSSNGGRKGEGIAGYETEYAVLYSEFGRGAPANGGGGGGYTNSGGGGGSNIGVGTYTGKGVPNPTYNAAWNLELPGLGGSSSPGGGRGGYTVSSSDQNALTLGPNQAAWSGAGRQINGGLGGHSLTYDATRLFMGGGGGAGDQDNGQGGGGGRGGGIAHVTVYGNISGTGIIEADGSVGQNSNPNNQVPVISPTSAQRKGNDGAGGGGAGGAVYIKNSSVIPAGIQVYARGGNGGNQVLSSYFSGTSFEAGGPGGAGSGGQIAFTSGTPTTSVAGGNSGTTNSGQLNEFPPNGATNGASGIGGIATTIFNMTANNATVCGSGSATLSVNVTGIAPGTITWYTTPYGNVSVGTGTSYTPTPTPATTTTFYVGVCPGTFRVPVTITVNPAPAISGTPILTNPSCSTPGSITGLTASGGTGALTYNWNSVVTAGPNLTNASAGSYTLIVTDALGCTASSGPHTLTGISGPTIDNTAVVVSSEICNGTFGSITGLIATGNSLTYAWNNGGGSSLNATNLFSGTYTLTVTDNLGCTATSGPYAVAFVAGPSIDDSGISIINETCTASNGSISGITSSGSGLSYSWSNGGGSSLNASNLSAGSYSLTVTDGNGCTDNSGPYSITDSPAPVIDISSIVLNDENCGNSDGSIAGITVSGGSPVYLISWTNTSQTTLDLSGLSSGSYSLTVSDQLGCSATAGPFSIANQTGTTIDNSNVVVQDEICNGTLGSISGLVVSGGQVPLVYAWNAAPSAGPVLSGASAGSYTLSVIDGNGCLAQSGPYTINYIAGPTLDESLASVTDESCNGTLGSITGFSATGTSLTYTWSNGGGNNMDATSLNAGNYSLTVTDINGCTASSVVYNVDFIVGPSIDNSGLVVSPENCNNANGAISGLSASGTSLSYSWSNGGGTAIDISNAVAGSYTLTVTDVNGCSDTEGPIVISNQGGPSIDDSGISIMDEHCSQNDGSISGMTVSGGSPAYTITWSNSTQSTLDLTSLAAGSYQLTVSDQNGCSISSGPYTVNAVAGPSIDVSSVVVQAELCDGTQGSVTGITASGTGLTYAWSNGGGTSLDATGLVPGTYGLTVTDAFGCTANAGPYTVAAPAGVSLDLSNMIVNETACTSNTGSISGIIIVGGNNPSPLWSNSETTLDISNLGAGSYTLTVTDDDGCTDQTSVEITMINAPSITSAIPTDVSCFGLSDGSIDVTIAGGTTPYSFTWTPNVGSTEDVTALAAGNYTVVVTDDVGCSDSETITVAETQELLLTLSVTDINCATGALGGIISNVTGGDGNYTYLWGNGETASSISNQNAGEYGLTVTDGNGCNSNTSGIIGTTGSIPVSVDPAYSEIDLGSSVQLNLTGTGTVVWTPNTTLDCTSCSDPVATPSNSTTYVAIVTDPNGCSGSDSATVVIKMVCGELFLPTIFSPNGTGPADNNMFKAFGNPSCVTEFKLQVFNRWGEMVFDTETIAEGWDGQYKSQDANTGIYVYRLFAVLIDGTVVDTSGNLTLVR